MSEEVLSEIVQSILDQLSYLSVQRHELIMENKSQIGAGGGGEVLLAKLRKSDEPEMDVAVKCVWAIGTLGDRQRFVKRFTRELKVWASVRHLNVLPLVGFYLSEGNEIAQLVSPFMANGNVTQYISRSKPELWRRWRLVEGITAGVDFLHNHRPPICHGDLKPTNVLISDSYEATLCDFGLASLVETPSASTGLTTSHSIKGSTRYMSPELLFETDGKPTLSSDVWAWACTVFEILIDLVPYSQESAEGLVIMAIGRGEVPGDVTRLLETGEDLRIPGSLSTLQSLLATCWSRDPAERRTIREIVQRAFAQSYETLADTFGFVEARIKASFNSGIWYYDKMTLPSRGLFDRFGGPWVCVKLNGVCHGSECCTAGPVTRYNIPSNFRGDFYVSFDADFDVHSSREFIVLEVKSPIDDVEKRLLGSVAIWVEELESVGSVSGQHSYAIEGVEGGIKLEYMLLLRRRAGILVPRRTAVFDEVGDLQSFTQRRGVPSGAQSTTSSATTFYTARTHLSSFPMSIPGAWSPYSPASRNNSMI